MINLYFVYNIICLYTTSYTNHNNINFYRIENEKEIRMKEAFDKLVHFNQPPPKKQTNQNSMPR